MNLTMMALLVALLLAIWLFIRMRKAPDDEPPPNLRMPKQDTTYHAVSIKFASNACDAARELAGRRFLSSAAPKLPLPGCDVLECSCRFVHHKDRRSGKDRRSPFAPAGYGAGTGNYEQEKRTGEDRRKKDDEDLF